MAEQNGDALNGNTGEQQFDCERVSETMRVTVGQADCLGMLLADFGASPRSPRPWR